MRRALVPDKPIGPYTERTKGPNKQERTDSRGRKYNRRGSFTFVLLSEAQQQGLTSYNIHNCDSLRRLRGDMDTLTKNMFMFGAGKPYPALGYALANIGSLGVRL